MTAETARQVGREISCGLSSRIRVHRLTGSRHFLWAKHVVAAGLPAKDGGSTPPASTIFCWLPEAPEGRSRPSHHYWQANPSRRRNPDAREWEVPGQLKAVPKFIRQQFGNFAAAGREACFVLAQLANPTVSPSPRTSIKSAWKPVTAPT